MKRVRLNAMRTRMSVMVHGFGEAQLRFRFGFVVKVTQRLVVLSFRDEYGRWTENYSAKTGIRTADIGNTTGWKINIADLQEKENYVPTDDSLRRSSVRKVHEETKQLSADETLVWQVWSHKGERPPASLYLKSFRKQVKLITHKDGEPPTQRIVEQPALVPFEKLIELLGEFVIGDE